MDMTLHESILTVEKKLFELTIQARTAVEDKPPLITLKINEVVVKNVPLVVVNDIIKMLETAKFAIKQHSLGGQ